MKIVADANIPYIKGVLEPYARMIYIPGREISRRDVAGADALLVRTRTRCGAELLEGSSVKFIGTATIGTDHIDIEYCRMNGISVASAPGSNARGVLQWVGAALNYLSTHEGWKPGDKTIGVVGVGHVGSLVKEYAAAWGFRVLCSDPPREENEGAGVSEGFLPFTELVGSSDIITFHTPLTGEGPYPTRNLAGEIFFSKIKHGAVIINSARGYVVNESLLKENIARGKCTACLDTWDDEPGIDRELLSLSAIATPHIAGYTLQGKANASAMVVNSLAGKFGLPLNGWYPLEEKPKPYSVPITWNELGRTIDRYCDIAMETERLKAQPGKFESFRENYNFREEYF